MEETSERGAIPLRPAGRVIVLDPQDRVLMFRYDDGPPNGRHWCTPGGGLNEGEDYLAGARRELAEETGWTDVPLGPEVYERTLVMEYDDEIVRQHERFFLARVEVAGRELGEVAAMHVSDGIAASRWWTLAELDATDEDIWPPGFADLIRGLLAGLAYGRNVGAGWQGSGHEPKDDTGGVMTTPDFWSGQDRMLTVADMENTPDDEFRYELDDGVPIVIPVPSRLRQLAVTRLTVLLSATCPAELIVLLGVGVNVSEFQHRVPDVAVVRNGSLETFFQETPPELVVEVTSPRTRLYDRNRKKDIYEGFGIPAYWIVEPDMDRAELIVFELRSGAYEQTAHVAGSEEYHAEIPFPVTITPSQLVSLRR